MRFAKWLIYLTPAFPGSASWRAGLCAEGTLTVINKAQIAIDSLDFNRFYSEWF